MGMIQIYERSKPKKRLTKAQEELQRQNEQLEAKWASAPKFARTTPKPKAEPVRAYQPAPEKAQPKAGKFDVGSTALPPKKVYTGDKMLGIATMHKSNSVPVFKEEEIKEIGKMRR